MNQKEVMLFPEKKLLTLSELEEKLSYRHVPLIQFENLADEQEIYLKGLEQEKRGEVSAQALELGERYHSLISSSYLSPASVRWVHEAVGYGLFAEETIEKGAYVGEYTGIVRKNDRRYFEPLNNYCYEYPVQDEIGRNYVIDASQGCLTRFINHSFHPNLEPCYAYWKGYYHLIFLSLCKVEIGEQLSYNYGESYWYLRQKPHGL